MKGKREQLRKRLAEEIEAATGGRLRTLRELAAAWEVSLRTAQGVVAEAVLEGRLETRQGAGIWRPGSRPVGSVPVVRMDAQGLAEEIAEGMRSGRYGAGQSLPAAKDLHQRHGLHPATVRKAYGILLSRGMVERTGRTWKVAGARPRAARPPVLLCLGASDGKGALRMDTDREWDFWREIQAEALRCGLEARLMPWDGVSVPEPDADVFGAIVSTWHLDDSRPLLDALLRIRLPAAVWVANHEALPGAGYRQARTLWFHDLAFGKESGATMARFLAGRGHRRIAWISPFHGSTWSRNRLAGLRDGLPPDFELFEAEEGWVSEWDIQKDVHKDPQVLGRIDLEGIVHGGEVEAIARPLVEAITRDRCLEAFGPKLERALGSGATLWVVASDLAASWCRHWLRTRGIDPPPMVSFDDSREASRTGLASLRFDVQGMARAMLRQILSSRRQHSRLTRYDGDVMVRASLRGGGTAPGPG